METKDPAYPQLERRWVDRRVTLSGVTQVAHHHAAKPTGVVNLFRFSARRSGTLALLSRFPPTSSLPYRNGHFRAFDHFRYISCADTAVRRATLGRLQGDDDVG